MPVVVRMLAEQMAWPVIVAGPKTTIVGVGARGEPPLAAHRGHVALKQPRRAQPALSQRLSELKRPAGPD